MESQIVTKTCTQCGRTLPLDQFGKGNGKDGKRSQCKECANRMAREYQKKEKVS